MITKTFFAAVALATMLLTSTAEAASREEKRVGDAADVLEQFLRIPEKTVPPALLSRQDDNSWSNPAFIKITAGSVGWQAGVQSTDIILVFKTRKGVDGIENGRLTLGADASVAAGPVGRHTGIATDLEFKAEVYSYSRSRGLFAGIALEGAGVTMDRKANAAFYGSSSMTPERIFVSSPNIAPDIANTFVQILTAQTSRLPTQPGMATGGPEAQEEQKSEVRTFGMPEAGSTDDEYDPNY